MPLRGFYLFLCGICMGAADLVPGISGGTIAFIMGFYGPLLESLKSFNYQSFKYLLTGQWRAFLQSTHWKFLLTLIAGIATAFLLFAGFIQFVLGHEFYRSYLYAAFLGLILGSFYFCIKQVVKWTMYESLGLAVGAVCAYCLTTISTSQAPLQGSYAVKIDLKYRSSELANYKDGVLTNLTEEALGVLAAKGMIESTTLVYDENGQLLGQVAELAAFPHTSSWLNGWLIFCGMVAVCALLLPGISGSYLLTLLGVYPMVIGALADWVSHLKQGLFDFDSFEILLNLGLGILIGALLFARFLSWLLKAHPNLSLAILSGFMIGALPSVWPFWSYASILLPMKLEKGPQLLALDPVWPSWFSSQAYLALLWMIAGCLLVIGIEFLAKYRGGNLDRRRAGEIARAREL